jgi:hypothetical protein
VFGRVVVPSSPLALQGTARCGTAPLRATRLPLAPPIVSEECSVDHAQAWGRCPATRGIGRVGAVGTTPPADGTMRPCARRRLGQEGSKCDEKTNGYDRKYFLSYPSSAASHCSIHCTTLSVRQRGPVIAPLDPRHQREGLWHRVGASGEEHRSQDAPLRHRQRWGFFSPSAL